MESEGMMLIIGFRTNTEITYILSQGL